MQETWVRSLGQADSPGEVNGNPLQYSGSSQVALVVKNPPANSGDVRHGFDPWVGRSPGEGHGNPLQYSCLENPMERGAWWAIMGLHRVGHN